MMLARHTHMSYNMQQRQKTRLLFKKYGIFHVYKCLDRNVFHPYDSSTFMLFVIHHFNVSAEVLASNVAQLLTIVSAVNRQPFLIKNKFYGIP